MCRESGSSRWGLKILKEAEQSQLEANGSAELVNTSSRLGKAEGEIFQFLLPPQNFLQQTSQLGSATVNSQSMSVNV